MLEEVLPSTMEDVFRARRNTHDRCAIRKTTMLARARAAIAKASGRMMWTCKHCGRVNPPERLMCRYKDCNPRGGKR